MVAAWRPATPLAIVRSTLFSASKFSGDDANGARKHVQLQLSKWRTADSDENADVLRSLWRLRLSDTQTRIQFLRSPSHLGYFRSLRFEPRVPQNTSEIWIEHTFEPIERPEQSVGTEGFFGSAHITESSECFQGLRRDGHCETGAPVEAEYKLWRRRAGNR